MKTLKMFSLVLVMAVIVLPSCQKNEYRENTTNEQKTVTSHGAGRAQMGVMQPSINNDVIVTVNTLSPSETKSLFHKRGRYLTKGNDGIIPLRVVIQNRTNSTVIAKPAMMAITNPDMVFRKIERNVAGISIASAVGGALLAGDLGALAFGGGFGISNAKKNDKMRNEIEHDSFWAPREIYPHSTLNKIMFVLKSDMQSTFSIPVGGQMHQIRLA